MNTIETTDLTRTLCCYCGVGCGVTATRTGESSYDLAGDSAHPANFGRLCVKGASLYETRSFADRLHTPMLHGAPVGWDEALTYTAEKFRAIIAEHGPDAVAFYLSGQLLTEDYYVANKLMKGFIGSANVDTNSRLCMASAVVAHKRAFGEDIVPGNYTDLEQCELLVLVGSNMAYTHPVVYQRIVAAKQRRPMRVVVIDPRRTPTCDLADQHLALRPGSDAFLFNGLLSYLAAHNALDEPFLDAHCSGFDDALDAARRSNPDLATTAALCDLPLAALEEFFALFAATEKTVTVFSQGINQSSSGVDKGNALINCHLATGRIGKPGAAPFSITGQPNAMGGREVGGLANQLAAHMNFGDADAHDRVCRFWNTSALARKEGLKAVDMFDAVLRGQIKAIWIMATNPVVSMPDADTVRRALRACELVVVSDCVANTDTCREATVLLPATTWGEKTGTVTNSERRISLQRAFIEPPGQARHDWQMLVDFAHKMGFSEGFNFTSVRDIFVEHAALSGFENNGSRAFDISALSTLSDQQYLNLQPIQWPVTAAAPSGTARMFTDNRFYTANGKAKLIPIAPRFPAKPLAAGQVLLNTGRIRDQWHSMGRTGTTAKLVSHIDEPFVALHPATARDLGIREGDIVELGNGQSHFRGRAKVNDGMRPHEVFAPIHWNRRFASHARVSALCFPIVDPLCGQPEFKHAPVTAARLDLAWQGFLLTVAPLSLETDYWCRIALAQGLKYRLAGAKKPADWNRWLQQLLPAITDWVYYRDSANEFYKAAGFCEERLVVYFATAGNDHPKALETHWLEQQLARAVAPANRAQVLAGGPGKAGDDTGEIICSCFQVGERAILRQIAKGAHCAAQLGKALRCGTNCGSCIPELNALIAQHKPRKAG